MTRVGSGRAGLATSASVPQPTPAASPAPSPPPLHPAPRSPLQRLYTACLVLAGVALVAVFALMIGETLLRKFLGGYIPGAGQLIAWCCAAAAFLAMPHAFRSGDFVRVDLLKSRLPESARRWAEAATLAAMLGFVGFAAWACARYVHGAYQADELTQGLLELPLWWAQASMVLGLAVLTLAVAECLWQVLRGQSPAYALAEAQRAGDGSAGI